MTKLEQALVFSPLELQTEAAMSSGLRFYYCQNWALRDPDLEPPVGFILPPNLFLKTLGAQDFCSLLTLLSKAAPHTLQSLVPGKPPQDEKVEVRHLEVYGPKE